MDIQDQIREGVALGPLTTFGVGGAAKWFTVARSETGVSAAWAWAQEHRVGLFVLGGGSNLLVRDEGFAGLVLRMEIRGVENCGDGEFEVGAGESWDDFVQQMAVGRFAGVECMAGIPGSVGGTPVQNVGAYGQEVAEVIESVEALDRATGCFVVLGKEDCRFRYRESRFNVDEPGRFVVTRVKFKLRPGGKPTLKYAELKKRVSELASEPVSLIEVARIVREIRRSKGMLIVEGDADCRSAGSFFKNPVIDAIGLERVAAGAGVAVSEVPQWPAGDGRVKLAAAWLLEKAGFVKGFGEGRVGISSKHTLAVVNRGEATFEDVSRFEGEIVAKVKEKFGVGLVREPVVL